MRTDKVHDRIRRHAVAAELAAEVLVAMSEVPQLGTFLDFVLNAFRERTGCEQVTLVRPKQGRWFVVRSTDPEHAVPEPLLAETLDRGEAHASSPWAAAALERRAASGELLLVQSSSHLPRELSAMVEALAALLGVSLSLLRAHHQQASRAALLQTLAEVCRPGDGDVDARRWLAQVLNSCRRLLDVEGSGVLVHIHGKQSLSGWFLTQQQDMLEIEFPFDDASQRMVCGEFECRLISTNSLPDSAVSEYLEKPLGARIQQYMIAPLRLGLGKKEGWLAVFNKQTNAFNCDDEDTVSEFALQLGRTVSESAAVRNLLWTSDNDGAGSFQLLGSSPQIVELRDKIERIAQTDLSVLILGENGTGKEVVSRLIHETGPRGKKTFVAVNCAALTKTLLESELFGHEKGAFTDAHETQAGKFELANGGTVFLDEVADLPLPGQAKLLRVLEEREVIRVGGSTPIATDTRVLAATNRDISQLVHEGKFREDLFFRLNAVVIQLPPLRERGQDIIELATHFIEIYSDRAGRAPPVLSSLACKRLRQYHWPGNIRQLRNFMEQLAYLTEEDAIDAETIELQLPSVEASSSKRTETTLADATRQFQVDYIQSQIQRVNGNMTEAARLLGLHRSNLYRKMQQLDMNTDDDPMS